MGREGDWEREGVARLCECGGGGGDVIVWMQWRRRDRVRYALLN